MASGPARSLGLRQQETSQGGAVAGVGHSLPQSYHLPSEPQRLPHATPMGGRGPPRLAESWAKRSNGSLFGPGAAQGPAWKPRAHRPQDLRRDTIRGTRGPQETGPPRRPGCSVHTPGGSDTQLKETSDGTGPRVQCTRPATLHPGEGQAILTVSVCKTRSQPYTQTDNKCTDELPAGLWSKGESGGFPVPRAEDTPWSQQRPWTHMCLPSKQKTLSRPRADIFFSPNSTAQFN